MKTFTFGIRETPHGAVAWMQPPSGGLREKQFRNGYASAKHSAQKQIDEWISVIREGTEVDGGPQYEIAETHKSGRGGKQKGAGQKPAQKGTTKVGESGKQNPNRRQNDDRRNQSKVTGST